MQTLRLTLAPRSAFGTTLKGDTLFGHLCWALRHRLGEARLAELLSGYTCGQPFVVVSDAFPTGHLPRPVLPTAYFKLPEGDRKAIKKRAWLPLAAIEQPLQSWLGHCVAPEALPGSTPRKHPQPHNSINRESNTTGNGFDPYSQNQLWYGANARLDVWLAFDDARLTHDELTSAMADIGASGFGRDASIGLGKFDLAECTAQALPAQTGTNAWLTLAPCAPQGLPWDATRCFYQPFTRFGRHGDMAVQSGKPFKAPVLLADTGAVLSPHACAPAAFTGQGLGGDGSLSKAIPATVHQGYAPVVGIRFPHQGGEA